MENFRHAFSIHYPYWGGFWGWGRGAKPGTINLRGLCHFCPKKWSNFPSTKKISFVLLNITIVQLIITHINLGGAPWNGTFGFFEQCVYYREVCLLFKPNHTIMWWCLKGVPCSIGDHKFIQGENPAWKLIWIVANEIWIVLELNQTGFFPLFQKSRKFVVRNFLLILSKDDVITHSFIIELCC